MTDDYPELEQLIEYIKNKLGIKDWTLEYDEKFKELKSQIITEHQIVERLRKEYQLCNKDMDRHQTPVGWNNYGIADSIAEILGSIIIGCKHEDDSWTKQGLCDNCRKELQQLLDNKEGKI